MKVMIVSEEDYRLACEARDALLDIVGEDEGHPLVPLLERVADAADAYLTPSAKAIAG
jgi:hypothetical protein